MALRRLRNLHSSVSPSMLTSGSVGGDGVADDAVEVELGALGSVVSGVAGVIAGTIVVGEAVELVGDVIVGGVFDGLWFLASWFWHCWCYCN
ncbi:unnamed protein product [Peronospora destructor]|uniref:Uncharacterized protein n=1 Tax=Peronospora destructor TaxID=86335 RepID=A0AAV0UA24_9STRA|nr:unnamed protein product [Peronospora destructor]